MAVSQKAPLMSIAKGCTDGVDSILRNFLRMLYYILIIVVALTKRIKGKGFAAEPREYLVHQTPARYM